MCHLGGWQFGKPYVTQNHVFFIYLYIRERWSMCLSILFMEYVPSYPNRKCLSIPILHTIKPFLLAPKMVGARTQIDKNALVKKPICKLRMPISNAFSPVPTSSSRVKCWHSQPANWERKLWLHHIILHNYNIILVLDSKRHGLSTLGAGPAAIGPTWLLSNLQQLAGWSW